MHNLIRCLEAIEVGQVLHFLTPRNRTEMSLERDSAADLMNIKPRNKLETLPPAQKILKEMECPICWEVPKPYAQIFNCKKGHLICGDCKSQLRQPARCFCFANYSDGRNFFLENLLLYSTYTCSNESEGCKELLEGISLDEHAKICKFRPLTCNIQTHLPCDGTFVHVSKYLEHLKNRHRVQGQVKPTKDNIFHLAMYPESKNIIQVSFLVFDGKTFLVHSHIAGPIISFWVTLLDHTDQLVTDYQVRLTFNREDISLQYNHPLPVYSPRVDFNAQGPALCCAVIPVLSLKSIFYVRQRENADKLKLPFFCAVEKTVATVENEVKN